MLSSLPLITLRRDDEKTFCDTPLRRKWQIVSGEFHFRPWKHLRSKDKKDMFHNIALSLENIGIQVKSPYKLIPVQVLMHMHKYSIEHIVPRSKINGSSSGAAENDPRGWWIADRDMNSLRRNLPLALWPDRFDDDDDKHNTHFIRSVNGVDHFFPPNTKRPMLARIWLFVRYNFRCVDVFDPPSVAQTQHSDHICENAKLNVGQQEIEMNIKFKEKYGISNPLIEDASWLDEYEFIQACFHH